MSSSDDEIECLDRQEEKNNTTISLDSSREDQDSKKSGKASADQSNDGGDERSESEEENSEPELSGAECLEICKKFAQITDTDRALAMFYLQDTKWDLERALNSFFKSTETISGKTGDGTTSSKESAKKVVACFDVAKLNEDELLAASKEIEESRPIKSRNDDERVVSCDQIVSEDKGKENEDQHFKILSWNIDGLDKANLESRAHGVAKKIMTERPDVVLLQEVVYANEKILRDELELIYEFSSASIYANDDCLRSRLSAESKHYYVMILNKRKTCSVKSKNLIGFNNSVMSRNLLEVKLNYKSKVNVCVMTTHLESTADFAKQRIEQLKTCFEHMSKVEPNYLVFFGGDLNLRDSELSSFGGVPKGIYDVWESTGSRKECLYTWDCSRNCNLVMNSRFKPKFRFDRLYVRQSKVIDPNTLRQVDNSCVHTLMPVYFELEGLEKLKTCGRFCSDHWAIQAYCQVEANKAV